MTDTWPPPCRRSVLLQRPLLSPRFLQTASIQILKHPQHLRSLQLDLWKFFSSDPAGCHVSVEIAGVDQNLPPLPFSAWAVVRQATLITELVDQRLRDTRLLRRFFHCQHSTTSLYPS